MYFNLLPISTFALQSRASYVILSYSCLFYGDSLFVKLILRVLEAEIIDYAMVQIRDRKVLFFGSSNEKII